MAEIKGKQLKDASLDVTKLTGVATDVAAGKFLLTGSSQATQALSLDGDLSQSISGSTITLDVAAGAIDLTKLSSSAIVLESSGISSNDTDNALPTAAAVKDYVDTSISSSAASLNFTGDSGTDSLSLTADTLSFIGGANITTAVTDNQLSTALNSHISITSATLSGDLLVGGDLTVNGTTTTVNSTTVTVDDKNLELGSVATPSDVTADGGGITLKGATDKTFNWINTNNSWTSSEHIDLAATKEYKIGATSVVTSGGAAKVQPAVAGTGLSHDGNGTINVNLDLDGLNDVTITSAAEGNLLQNDASGQFVNVAKSTIDVGDFNDDATYQLRDAGLTSISGLTTAADKMIYTTAADTYAVTDLTLAGRDLLNATDATAQRSTLGLGTAATSDTGDFLASTAALNDISDVTISSVSNGQVISYNSTSGEWENSTPSSGGATDLDGLSDVTITSASSGQVLRNNGSGQFVNVALSIVDDTSPQLGGALDVNGQAITSASNGDVTIDPDGTGDISVGADIIPDADGTHTLGSEDNRFVTLHSELNGAVQFKARNETGGALTKGQAVYISGVSGDVPLVSLARANSASTMPAHGLLAADVSNNADVQVISFGNLTDYNTTTHSLSLGDTVYVSAATAGALTSSAPTGETNLIQNIGKVVRASGTVGIVKVGGAGRSAATPNLNDGKIFLGNASNQAVSTALSAVALSSFNNDLGLATVATTGAYSDLSGTPTLGTAAALDVGTGANNVVQLDGSSRLPAVDGSQLTNLPSGGGVDPTITVLSNTTYTLSAANAPGIHIWYGASNSSTFTVTMPDIANVISTAASVNGVPVETFEVYIGRAQGGDITVSAADGIDLLGDGSVSYSTTQTVNAGQWVKLIGWYVSGATQRYIMDSAAQPRDAALDSISGLTTSADQLIYTTASDTYATASLTAAGRALLDDADAAAQRATLGAIAELSEDLSPQLAGDLDLNGQDIVTTSNADLDLAPDGTGAVVLKGNTTGGNNQGKIKFNCENNSHAVTIQGPAHSAAATYTLTLPTSDGNANQVLKTDGSGVLDWVDQTSAGESEQIKQVSGNYTVTTADIEDGVRILYTGTASVWYVTLPDPSSLLSSASTVGGAAVDAVSVQVGRDRTGDINFASSTPQVGLLNDGNTGAANANRTTRGGEWVRSVGFYNGSTSDPDWLVEDTSNAYPWAYVAQTTTDYLAPSTYHACSGTITLNARISRFDNAQLVLVRNVGTGTITIDGYNTDTVDGQASITLSAGEYVELMANTSSSDFEIINQSYDASDLVAPHTGVNYTAANTDSITTHLAGIDTALGNVGGGGSSYTYSAITAGTTSAQAWYHYSVDTSSGGVTLNLPALSSLTDGDEIRVKLRDATNSVTIDGNSTENIDGSATFTLDVAYSAVTLVAGSTEWEIV